MPNTPIRQFKAKKVRVLTRKKTQCLRKNYKLWISNALLYKKLKIGISYLAKALSKEKKKSINMIEEIEQLHNNQTTAMSNVLNKAMEIQKLWVTEMEHVTNIISMRQEPHNSIVSSVSAERKESSNRSTELSTCVVKPTMSGKITKPTINSVRLLHTNARISEEDPLEGTHFMDDNTVSSQNQELDPDDSMSDDSSVAEEINLNWEAEYMNRKPTKQFWSKKETKDLVQLFGIFIRKNKLPSLIDVQRIKENNLEKFKNRTVQAIRLKVWSCIKENE